MRATLLSVILLTGCGRDTDQDKINGRLVHLAESQMRSIDLLRMRVEYLEIQVADLIEKSKKGK